MGFVLSHGGAVMEMKRSSSNRCWIRTIGTKRQVEEESELKRSVSRETRSHVQEEITSEDAD